MGFLRRLLGRPDDDDATAGQADDESAAASPAAPQLTDDEAERAHELELARFEQDRLTDLARRQQQYADRSWTPPAQGGEIRAEDAEKASS